MSTILSIFIVNRSGFRIFRIGFYYFFLFFLADCASLVHKTGLMWERSRSGLSIKEITIGEFKWKYSEAGDKNSDQVLIAIHGFGGDKDHWTRFARYIPDKYRIISPDLPGFGENSRIEGLSYSIEEQTGRLHEFAKSLGLKKYHIIGNSMGGAIAGVYTVKYPEEILTLTLLDNAGIKSPEPSEVMKMVISGKPNPLLINSVEDFDRLVAFSFVKPPYLPGTLKSYFVERAVSNRNWNEQILQQIRKEGYVLEPLISKIKPPTFVIWGKEDNIIHHSCTIVLEKKLKSKKRILILPDVGHAPMIEQPEETAKLWMDWIKEN
ncbi:alpha/beta fold hydrolase [Leptospira ilyithenensis]|uniref:Alpha/beta hydrolase n=1 Tax=Leptospira ilyithenensis TaxID=2484901 RepID=A0A4R9LRJ9_9LEPT|nr:alpha/beta hydrolase [Leptospira ilyithenensis]TGN13437.1 alpha/beta hydrolase [Leptospira ilyithenensis]